MRCQLLNPLFVLTLYLLCNAGTGNSAKPASGPVTVDSAEQLLWCQPLLSGAVCGEAAAVMVSAFVLQLAAYTMLRVTVGLPPALSFRSGSVAHLLGGSFCAFCWSTGECITANPWGPCCWCSMWPRSTLQPAAKQVQNRHSTLSPQTSHSTLSDRMYTFILMSQKIHQPASPGQQKRPWAVFTNRHM